MTEMFVANDAGRRRVYEMVAEFDYPYKVKVTKGNRRSIEQNAYLWAVVYPAILTQGGLGEQGWRGEDLHEYFLGEYHGWKTLEGFGRKRVKPLQRSSGKTVSEFMEYLDYVIQKAAELGIVVPDSEA